MMDLQSKRLMSLVTKCMIAFGTKDNKIDYRVLKDLFVGFVETHGIEWALVDWFLMVGMKSDIDYALGGLEALGGLGREALGDFLVKMTLVLCDGQKKKYNVGYFGLKEVNMFGLVNNIPEKLDVVSRYVEGRVDRVFEKIGFRQKIPGVYEVK